MRLSGGGSEDRNKIIAVAAFVLVAAIVVYVEMNWNSGTTNPAAVTAAAPAAGETATGVNEASGVAAAKIAGGNAAKRVGTTSAGLDPTLRMDAMLVSEQVEYSGVGRNIFSPNSAPPVVIPRPVASVRPTQAVPPPVVRSGPPPPPPIDLTFFGTETADSTGKRQAILLHEDTVYTAQAGDVVLRRYRILAIDAKSIQVEDLQNNNRQTLPLLADGG